MHWRRALLLSAVAAGAASAERSSNALLPLRLPELQPPQLPDGVRTFFRRAREWSSSFGIGGFSAGGGGGGSLRDDGGVPGEMVAAATSDSEEWKVQVEKKGVTVWRRSVPGSKNDEIRGNGLIRASPGAVLELLRDADEEVIRQYNPLYDRGYDLQEVDANTKVSYGAVRAVFPFKPRDTVTRVAFRELPASAGGGNVVLQRAVKHPSMPKRSGYVRAEVLRGMFVVQPVEGSPGLTNFTFTQQINVGGLPPAWLINQLVANDGVQLFTRLDSAARKYSPNKKKKKRRKGN